MDNLDIANYDRALSAFTNEVIEMREVVKRLSTLWAALECRVLQFHELLEAAKNERHKS